MPEDAVYTEMLQVSVDVPGFKSSLDEMAAAYENKLEEMSKAGVDLGAVSNVAGFGELSKEIEALAGQLSTLASTFTEAFSALGEVIESKFKSAAGASKAAAAETADAAEEAGEKALQVQLRIYQEQWRAFQELQAMEVQAREEALDKMAAAERRWYDRVVQNPGRLERLASTNPLGSDRQQAEAEEKRLRDEEYTIGKAQFNAGQEEQKRTEKAGREADKDLSQRLQAAEKRRSNELQVQRVLQQEDEKATAKRQREEERQQKQGVQSRSKLLQQRAKEEDENAAFQQRKASLADLTETQITTAAIKGESLRIAAAKAEGQQEEAIRRGATEAENAAWASTTEAAQKAVELQGEYLKKLATLKETLSGEATADVIKNLEREVAATKTAATEMESAFKAAQRAATAAAPKPEKRRGDFFSGLIPENFSEFVGNVIRFQLAWGAVGAVMHGVEDIGRGIADAFKSGWNYLENVQDAAAQLHVVLASNVEYSKDLATNFELAQQAAQLVAAKFQDVGAKTGLDPKQLTQTFASFIDAGGASLVKNTQQQVEFITNLSLAARTVSADPMDQRKILRDIPKLLDGTIDKSSSLLRIMGLTKDEWIKVRDNALKYHDLLGSINDKMAPMVQEGEELSKTTRNRTAAIKEMFDQMMGSFEKPIFKAWNDELGKLEDKLQESQSKSKDAAAQLGQDTYNTLSTLYAMGEGTAKILEKALKYSGLDYTWNDPVNQFGHQQISKGNGYGAMASYVFGGGSDGHQDVPVMDSSGSSLHPVIGSVVLPGGKHLFLQDFTKTLTNPGLGNYNPLYAGGTKTAAHLSPEAQAAISKYESQVSLDTPVSGKGAHTYGEGTTGPKYPGDAEASKFLDFYRQAVEITQQFGKEYRTTIRSAMDSGAMSTAEGSKKIIAALQAEAQQVRNLRDVYLDLIGKVEKANPATLTKYELSVAGIAGKEFASTGSAEASTRSAATKTAQAVSLQTLKDKSNLVIQNQQASVQRLQDLASRGLATQKSVIEQKIALENLDFTQTMAIQSKELQQAGKNEQKREEVLAQGEKRQQQHVNAMRSLHQQLANAGLDKQMQASRDKASEAQAWYKRVEAEVNYGLSGGAAPPEQQKQAQILLASAYADTIKVQLEQAKVQLDLLTNAHATSDQLKVQVAVMNDLATASINAQAKLNGLQQSLNHVPLDIFGGENASPIGRVLSGIFKKGSGDSIASLFEGKNIWGDPNGHFNLGHTAKTLGGITQGVVETFSAITQGMRENGIGGAIGAGFSQVGGMVGGPVGAVMQTVGGIISAISGMFTAAAKHIAENIATQFDLTMRKYQNGQASLSATLQQVEQERTDAINRLSGQKGGQDQLNKLLPQFDQIIAQLKQQQTQIVDSFERSAKEMQLIGDLGGTTLNTFAQKWTQINDEVEKYLSAGGSVQTANQYISDSLKQLQQQAENGLNSGLQTAIQDAQNLNNLIPQRTQLEQQEKQKEFGIQNGDALERNLAPAIRIGQQLSQARTQYNQQLTNLNNQIVLVTQKVALEKQVYNLATDTASLNAASNALALVNLQQQVEQWKQMKEIVQGITNVNGQYQFTGNFGNIMTAIGALNPAQFTPITNVGTVNITVNSPTGTSATDVANATVDAISSNQYRYGMNGYGPPNQFGG